MDRAHELLGHGGEHTSRATEAHLKLKVVENMSECVHCASSEAKNNINKKSDHIIATKSEKRLFSDVSITKKQRSLILRFLCLIGGFW